MTSLNFAFEADLGDEFFLAEDMTGVEEDEGCEWESRQADSRREDISDTGRAAVAVDSVALIYTGWQNTLTHLSLAYTERLRPFTNIAPGSS